VGSKEMRLPAADGTPPAILAVVVAGFTCLIRMRWPLA